MLETPSDWKVRPVRCVVCGKFFIRSKNWGERHCSTTCLRIHNTSRHAKYVARNQRRVRQNATSWKDRTWGRSGPQIAKRAEVIAETAILPKIGFTELINIAAFRRLVPFDIVGTLGSKRALVDVTTGNWKGGKYLKTASALADALGLPFYVLFVKPNMHHFALKPVEKGRGVYCSLDDLTVLEQ